MKASSGPSTAPREWTLVFCGSCGELLGAEDHTRIRSEHFDQSGHQGYRRIDVVERASLDRVVEERDELREALRAVVDRHGDYYPMGSWRIPGHDVIDAEWERARAALQSGEGGTA